MGLSLGLASLLGVCVFLVTNKRIWVLGGMCLLIIIFSVNGKRELLLQKLFWTNLFKPAVGIYSMSLEKVEICLTRRSNRINGAFIC